MASPPRRARHHGFEPEQHLLVHDDELDDIDREGAERERRIEQRLDMMSGKMDRLIWAMVGAALSGATAALLLAVQLVVNGSP